MAVVQQNIQLHLISAFAVVVSIAYVWSIRKKANNITNGENLPEWIKIKSKELPSFQYPVNKQASPSLDKTQTQSMDTCLSLDKSKIHQLRQDHFCGSQSVSYSNTDPLLIVRGEGSKLYDEKGVEYLDTRNNVGHVGHSHPKVVYEIAKQASAINTNTRYLHPNHVRLANKLLQRCPSPLKRVFFVNSGSEANDLALRLARAYTKNKQVIVVDHAYHGHTTEMINISPYKFAKKGGVGKRSWVHVVSAPDTYRGEYADQEKAGYLYAQQVDDICTNFRNLKSKVASSIEDSQGLAAFFIESGMSVAGVILPPEGYMKHCFDCVHSAGGVNICDEVQVGFGRFGDTFWAFEQAGVVPDIVTCGKPFGNGMPLAAVITTDDIANTFENCGIEYFNTFGGNPVSCAAGLAVMDIIEEEGLMQHASKVGNYLKKHLFQLAEVHPNIGHVRGRGLFIGIDLVLDRESRHPAPAHASMVTTILKDKFRILTSIDGPHHNVIVMKPPMQFSFKDSDYFLASLSKALDSVEALGERVNDAKHTPT